MTYAYDLFNPPTLNMEISSTLTGRCTDPSLFGPPLWFVLHNGASCYPHRPSPIVQKNMMGFIDGLHVIIPCASCKEHAYRFIKNHTLATVTASRETLFRFFVQFHNYVNIRHGKRTMSLEEAKQLYGFDKPHGGGLIKITYH